VTTPPTESNPGIRWIVLGLLVNVGLAGVKLIAGLVGNSYALVADAIESGADIFASAVIWGGLRIADRPADAEHPYGHGKAEALAALVVVLMLFVAGIGIAIQAIRELFRPHQTPEPFTLWILIGVVVIKEALFRFVQHIGTRVQSSAITTDAWHHRSDALTSAAAAIGITISLIGGPGYAAADDVAA
jgi:cation diffusion facilitator family transporter